MLSRTKWKIERIDGFWCAYSSHSQTIKCASEADARKAVSLLMIEYKQGQASVVEAIAKAAGAPDPYALIEG